MQLGWNPRRHAASTTGESFGTAVSFIRAARDRAQAAQCASGAGVRQAGGRDSDKLRDPAADPARRRAQQ